MKKQHDFAQALSEILMQHKAVTQEQAVSLKKLFYDRSKPGFVDFLLEEGFVSKDAILKALSEYYQVPAFEVVGHFFDQHLVQMFPLDILLRNVMIPLEQDENMLVVVASEPSNPELLSILGDYVSYDIRFQVGITQDIKDAVREFSDYAVTQYPEMIDVDLKKEQQERNEVRGLVLEDEEQD